jgi:hypothetical protein
MIQPRTARALIDRLAANHITPPELVNVPPNIYQSMLKMLRSKL